MSLADVLFAAAFLGSFVLGLRSTVRLWDRYSYGREPRSRILLAFVVIACALTLVAGWVGFLALRRLLGFEAVPWTPIVTYGLAIIIVAIPVWLDYIAEGIESGRYER